MRKLLSASLLATCLGSAHGAQTPITSNPTAWRLENYAGGVVVLWFTSSPCPSGQITFGPSASPADANRLWATVSVAKTTGRKMFLTYDNANAPTVCPIVSFGLDSE